MGPPPSIHSIPPPQNTEPKKAVQPKERPLPKDTTADAAVNRRSTNALSQHQRNTIVPPSLSHAKEDYVELRQEVVDLQEYSNAKLDRVKRYLGVLAYKTSKLGFRYKGWGSLLGFQLAERHIIVTCLDYRNFPQGTISDMVEDVSRGITFICNNIANYGGEPNRIYLMGQFAGAHISSCVLLK
ncbi:hypothetical protein L2E82_15069 [Cichorium intybus]|uniref:Uncharacterized protein n=1 Tax=Cichorium intybus TaxID=13427 RepID=A0ACB9F1Q9_CICIN|nr:hypothetical protein L2E82_15069 [Cichorium intybus]